MYPGILWTGRRHRLILERRTPAVGAAPEAEPTTAGTMYILITVILAVLISGIGGTLAFFCRLPELDGRSDGAA